jgi:hypothetical protein
MVITQGTGEILVESKTTKVAWLHDVVRRTQD